MTLIALADKMRDLAIEVGTQERLKRQHDVICQTRDRGQEIAQQAQRLLSIYQAIEDLLTREDRPSLQQRIQKLKADAQQVAAEFEAQPSQADALKRIGEALQ